MLFWVDLEITGALRRVKTLRLMKSVEEVKLTRVGLPPTGAVPVRIQGLDDLTWAYVVQARLRKGFEWRERLREGWVNAI